MSKAPEFVRTNRPMVRDGAGNIREGIFEDSDPVFCPITLSEAEKDKFVIRAVEYRGYICKQRQPYLHWIVFASVDGSELPLELQGHFTNRITLKSAIDKHIGAEKEQVQA